MVLLFTSKLRHHLLCSQEFYLKDPQDVPGFISAHWWSSNIDSSTQRGGCATHIQTFAVSSNSRTDPFTTETPKHVSQTLHTLHKDLRALLAPAADIWKDAFMDWYSKSADHDRPSCTSPQVGRGKRKDWLADADEIKVLSFWYIPSGFLWRPSGDIFLFMDLHFVHRQCRRWVRDWTQDNEYLMLSVISAKCVPKIQKKRRKTDWLVGSICWWNFVFIYNCIYLCTQFIYRSDAS